MDEVHDSLSELQIDTIREISNIGMGNAATALSQMVDRQVAIAVPRAILMDLTEAPVMLGGEELPVAATYVQVLGQARGHLMMVFTLEGAQTMIDMIAPGTKFDLQSADPMAQSALQEIGNILSSNFLRSLSEMTQLNLHPTVPAVAIDYAGSIISYVVSSMAEVTEKLVTVQTNFDIDGNTLDGYCIFIPEPGSLQIILESLGVWNG